jgi:transmembrane sensor
MSQTLFWNLLAKKITGEASEQELRQLEDLMKLNHDWAYQAEHIQEFWQYKNDAGKQESELAFEQHLQRMKDAGVELPESEFPQINFEINYSKRRRKILAFSVAAIFIFFIAGAIWLTGDKKKINAPR